MPTKEEILAEKIQELTINVRDKIDIIDKVNRELKEQRITVTKLRKELDHCASERDIFREQAKESTATLEKCRIEIKQLDQTKDQNLQNSLNNLRDDYEIQIKEMTTGSNNLKNERNSHANIIADLEYESSQLKQKLDECQKDLYNSQLELKKATNEIIDGKSHISALNSALQTKDENIFILKGKLQEKSRNLENVSSGFDRKKLDFEDLENLLKRKKMELAQSKNESKSLTTDLSRKIEDYMAANRILILQIDRIKKYLDETDDKVKILQALKDNKQGMSKIGITGALGIPPRVVQEYLDDLNQRQFIELSQDGRAIFKKFPWT